MPDYVAFFLNGSPSAVRLDTLEISHPNFSRRYFLVRNHADGITATLENGNEQAFEYYPFVIQDAESTQSLDFSINIILGDLGEVLPMEIDRVRTANAMGTPPDVVYRSFSSDDMSRPMEGPLMLQMGNPTTEQRGATFSAIPRRANNSGTGEAYLFSRFPMLRGTL